MKTQGVKLTSARDWKSAMQRRLQADGISRYQFIRVCVDEGIVSRHSGECLLADEGTVTGDRIPSFEVAIRMAQIAGYEVRLVPLRAKVTT